MERASLSTKFSTRFTKRPARWPGRRTPQDITQLRDEDRIVLAVEAGRL